MVAQHACSEELWVATHHLFFPLTSGVREVDIVTQDFQETLRLIHASHDGTHLVYATLCRRVFVAHLLPRIIVFIRRIGGAELSIVLRGIADAR